MQITTELNGMFSYSIIWIIISLFITIFLLIILKQLNNKYQKGKPVVIKQPKKSVDIIKEIYLDKLEELQDCVNCEKISIRKGYQELSIIIRDFVYEMTGIKVQYYTLADIKNIDMPILYELIKYYYVKEFATISDGNILESINKARKVIEKWN